MKSLVPKRVIHQFVTSSYSRTNVFRDHTFDAVYISIVRNNILTGEKQD